VKNIWAPWRVQYIRSEKPKGCLLCEKAAQVQDRGNYLLYRGRLNFAMLNKYPYNPGHIMVSPYRHTGSLEDLSDEELLDNMLLVKKCLKALKEAFSPQGFNLGINLGRVAGAGVEDHVHVHIVPRWNGDTNFMPVVAEIKVVSEAMNSTYDHLKRKLG
jgi:ATP adenylyltransferase